MGTPDATLLDRFQKHATHMEFDFPAKKYVGISRLIAHVSKECQELILWMITYNPDDRPSASQIIKHAYFKDLKELDDSKRGGAIKGVAMDNLSQYSRRNSDKASDGGDGGDSVNSKSFNNKSKKKFIKNSHQINFPPIKNIKDSKKKKAKKATVQHEFKHSLKHNSSNHSITGKKIIPGVKKFYSPYSQRPHK